MQSIREKKKKQTTRAIMEAAIALFSEKGYEQTSMEELARAAGIGKSTIYGYFRTKSEIFLAFCEDEIDFVFAELSRRSDPGAPLVERIHALFMGQFRYVTRHHDFGRLLAREMVFPKELTVEKSKDIQQRYLSALYEILDRAVAHGELRNDLEPLFVAGHFYALYILVLSAWYERRFETMEEIESGLKRLLTQAMEGLRPHRSASE